MISLLKCLLLTSDSFELYRISGKFDILNSKLTEKKKKSIPREGLVWIVRSLWMTVFYGMGKTLLIGQQPWAPKQEAPQKLIPWEAENTARPTQPIWKPHRCVISIFFARLKSHNKKGPMDFGQIFARTELFAKVRRIDDFSSSGKKRITYL